MRYRTHDSTVPFGPWRAAMAVTVFALAAVLSRYFTPTP